MSMTESKCVKSHVTAGPWGGTCGARWDDGVNCSIRQLIITHGAVIDSLQIEYESQGRSVWSEKHGGSGAGGARADKVKLDHPDEYLVSLSGFYGSVSDSGPTVVRSIAVETNRRRYGPFGTQSGTHFTFSMSGGKIVGFYGRAGAHLDSLGIYLKPFVTVKTTAQVQAHNLAQAHMAAVVGGNRGYDVMLAVREKMDNMTLTTHGASTEYDRNEKNHRHEDVKGKVYHMQNRKEEIEKESYTIMTTSAAYKESDHHRVPFTIGMPMKAHPQIERLPIKGHETTHHDASSYAGYDTTGKFHGSVDAEKGYSNTKHSTLVGTQNFGASHESPFSEYATKDKLKFHGGVEAEKGYTNIKHSTAIGTQNFGASNESPFSEYATKEKVKFQGYGSTGAEKCYPTQIQTQDDSYYMNMKHKEGQMYNQTGAFSEYEAREKVYTTGNTAMVSPTMGKPVMKYGPWGGSGGMLYDDGVYTGVREIHIARSVGVVYFRVCYDMNGKAVWGEKNGGNGAIRLDKISLDYPEEYLTRVSGYYGSTIFRGPTVIKSLTFHTNKKKYGPFGEEQGIPFSSAQKQGVIVGFHGTKGWFLDSIGVHFFEGKSSTTITSDVKFGEQVFNGPPKCPSSYGSGGMVKEPNGPWGGNGGNPFDDGTYTGIKKIVLTRSHEAILAIQIEYDRNGHSIWSVKHGNNNDCCCHVVQFEYPQEIVTGISGYYGLVAAGDDCKKVVKSLTFHTNKRRFGPFGEETGTHFASTGRVVGFNGNSGCYLYALGVHIQPHLVNSRVDHPGTIKTMLHKIFS